MQHEDFLAVFATVFTFMCTVSRVCAGTAAAAKSATNTASLQEQCKAAQRHCSSSAGAACGQAKLQMAQLPRLPGIVQALQGHTAMLPDELSLPRRFVPAVGS